MRYPLKRNALRLCITVGIEWSISSWGKEGREVYIGEGEREREGEWMERERGWEFGSLESQRQWFSFPGRRLVFSCSLFDGPDAGREGGV